MTTTRNSEVQKRLSEELGLALDKLNKNDNAISLKILKYVMLCVIAGMLEPLAGRLNAQIIFLAGLLLLSRQMHLYQQNKNKTDELTQQLENIKIQEPLVTYSVLSTQRNNRSFTRTAIQRNNHGPH